MRKYTNASAFVFLSHIASAFSQTLRHRMATLQLTVSLPDANDSLSLLSQICSAQRTQEYPQPPSLSGPAFAPIAIGHALACSLISEPAKHELANDGLSEQTGTLPPVVSTEAQFKGSPALLAPPVANSTPTASKALEALEALEAPKPPKPPKVAKAAKPDARISKRNGKKAASASVSTSHLLKLADDVLRETAIASDKVLMDKANASYWKIHAALERKAGHVSASDATALFDLVEIFRGVHQRFRGAYQQILLKSKSAEVTMDVRTLLSMWEKELSSVSKDGGIGIGTLKKLLKSLALFFGKYGSAWIKAIKSMPMSQADKASMGAFFMFFDTTSRDAAAAVDYTRLVTAKHMREAYRNR